MNSVSKGTGSTTTASGRTASQYSGAESTTSGPIQTVIMTQVLPGSGTSRPTQPMETATDSLKGTKASKTTPSKTDTTVSQFAGSESTTSVPVQTMVITQVLTGSASLRPTEAMKTTSDLLPDTTTRRQPTSNILLFVATLAGVTFTPALANPNSPRRRQLEQQLTDSFISLLNNTIYNDTIENVTINDVEGEVGQPARVTYTIHTRHGSGVTGEELEQAMRAAQDGSHPNINLPTVCYLGGSGPCTATTTARMSTLAPIKMFNFRVELKGRNFTTGLNNKSSPDFTHASRQLLDSLKSYLNTTRHANAINDVTIRSFQDGDPMTAIFTVTSAPGSRVTGGQLEEALRTANKFDDPLDIDLPTMCWIDEKDWPCTQKRKHRFQAKLRGQIYKAGLDNPNSTEYRNLTDKFLQTLHEYYRNTSYADDIEKITVDGFHGNPFVVNYTVHTTGGSKVTGDELEAALRNATKYDDPVNLELPTVCYIDNRTDPCYGSVVTTPRRYAIQLSRREYHPDLADSTSEQFKELEDELVATLWRYYAAEGYAKDIHSIQVNGFSPGLIADYTVNLRDDSDVTGLQLQNALWSAQKHGDSLGLELGTTCWLDEPAEENGRPPCRITKTSPPVEFKSELNSTRAPLTKRHRDLIVRTPRGTPSVAGIPPRHISYVTDQMNRIKPMPARLLNPARASRGYIPDGHRRNWDLSFSRHTGQVILYAERVTRQAFAHTSAKPQDVGWILWPVVVALLASAALIPLAAQLPKACAGAHLPSRGAYAPKDQLYIPKDKMYRGFDGGKGGVQVRRYLPGREAGLHSEALGRFDKAGRRGCTLRRWDGLIRYSREEWGGGRVEAGKKRRGGREGLHPEALGRFDKIKPQPQPPRHSYNPLNFRTEPPAPRHTYNPKPSAPPRPPPPAPRPTAPPPPKAPIVPKPAPAAPAPKPHTYNPVPKPKPPPRRPKPPPRRPKAPPRRPKPPPRRPKPPPRRLKPLPKAPLRRIRPRTYNPRPYPQQQQAPKPPPRTKVKVKIIPMPEPVPPPMTETVVHIVPLPKPPPAINTYNPVQYEAPKPIPNGNVSTVGGSQSLPPPHTYNPLANEKRLPNWPDGAPLMNGRPRSAPHTYNPMPNGFVPRSLRGSLSLDL
ncbi:hypothetical protein Bbelb_323580 [Branchiostoma belcheri]|nr:hypothetical protein Bbelb_323580 [Branchiostoma belcheri]